MEITINCTKCGGAGVITDGNGTMTCPRCDGSTTSVFGHANIDDLISLVKSTNEMTEKILSIVSKS